jgi:hypothetical protein
MPRSPSLRRSLRWEITGILVFKLTIILVAGFTIFGASHRVHVNADAMTNKILSNVKPTTVEKTRE